MNARLLHGILLGALTASVSAFLELLARLNAYPYHRDFDAFRIWLPKYALTGCLIGLLAALLLPWVSRGVDRNRQQGVHLLALILGMQALLFMAPRGLPAESWQILLGVGLKAALVGGSVYLFGYLFARSKYAWVITGFTTPWFSCVALLFVFSLASFTDRISPWPAPNAPLVADRESISETGVRNPNVILVVLDGVGAEHLGCYGYRRSTSPELDRLASESVLFENAFSAAPWTLPSHASLFTGLQQSSHGVGWEHLRLADGSDPRLDLPNMDAWTLAEELVVRGFQTCGVSDSEWVTNVHGLSQGFQHFYDFQSKSVPRRMFLARLFEDLSLLDSEGTWESSGQRSVQTALNWISTPRLRKKDQPFFLFLNLNEAETPYAFPQGFTKKARFLPSGVDLSTLTPEYLATNETRRSFNLGERSLKNQEAEIQKGLYDAAILYQDELLGQLIEGLREQDLLENSIVVFVADHGEEFNEQNRFGHQCSLSDRVLHVPFLIRYPSLLPAGRRVSELVSLVDVFPTIIGLLQTITGVSPQNISQLRTLEGFDLTDISMGNDDAPRDWILAQYQNPARLVFQGSRKLLPSSSAWQARSITTLRSAHSKYFRFGDGSQAFLDLTRDPDENASESGTIPNESRAMADSYSKSLQQLENWLITRRTILLSKSDSPGTWPILNAEAISELNFLGMPPRLLPPQNED